MEVNDELDQMAFKFFKLFAQYESALKELRFFVANPRGGVIVDWDRFAKERIGSGYLTELGD